MTETTAECLAAALMRCARPRSGSSPRPAPLLLVGLDLLGARLALLLVRRDLEAVAGIEHRRVQLDVIGEHARGRGLLEDRLPRALRLAGAAVDALVRMDIELVRETGLVIAGVAVDAIDRADRHAG